MFLLHSVHEWNEFNTLIQEDPCEQITSDKRNREPFSFSLPGSNFSVSFSEGHLVSKSQGVKQTKPGKLLSHFF